MHFSLFVIAALSATSSIGGMVSAAVASVSKTRKTGEKMEAAHPEQ